MNLGSRHTSQGSPRIHYRSFHRKRRWIDHASRCIRRKLVASTFTGPLTKFASLYRTSHRSSRCLTCGRDHRNAKTLQKQTCAHLPPPNRAPTAGKSCHFTWWAFQDCRGHISKSNSLGLFDNSLLWYKHSLYKDQCTQLSTLYHQRTSMRPNWRAWNTISST